MPNDLTLCLPSNVELNERLQQYIAELEQSPGQLQSPRDIIARLRGIATEDGPRLPPFTWTAEEQDALRVGDYVTAYMGVYPPFTPAEKTIRRIERSIHNPKYVTYHLADKIGYMAAGHCGIERLDPESYVSLASRVEALETQELED